MARRKVVLFVVEGPSEELALGYILSRLFEGQGAVRIEVMYGDILTKWRFGTVPSGRTPAKDVADRVRDCVVDYLGGNSPKLKWTDLACIIQLSDTDGAYVADDFVACEDDAELRRTLNTFHMKQESTKRLLRRSHLTYRGQSVPYGLYYFSKNLEHALHNRDEGLSDEDKLVLARRFQQEYRNDVNGFIELMKELCPCLGYKESWDFIRESTNSCSRCSNFLLALPTDAGDWGEESPA